MKKVKFISVVSIAILVCWHFLSCKENDEVSPVYAPQIISMNFATSEEAYFQNNYLSSTAYAGELYIGFELSDEDKDIKVINKKDNTLLSQLSHLLSIPTMDTVTTSFGFYIKLSTNETLTLYAYARDFQGNISDTIEKTITLVPYVPEVINHHQRWWLEM